MISATTSKLSEAATLVSGGTPSKGNPEYWNGSIPWLTPKDMNGYDGTTEARVTAAAIGNGTKLVPAGTIFVAVRGMSLHKEIRVIRSPHALTFNQDIKAILPKGIDADFLYFALTAHKPTLLGLVESAGHGTGVLPTDRLTNLPIMRFGPAEERAIGMFFRAIDDKIDLNRCMNETLDAMTRAIFKDWFVDFGPTRAKMERRSAYLAPELWALFPDRLDHEEKPEGWKYEKLANLCARVAMGPFGSDITTDNFVESGVPIIRGVNLKDGFVDNSFVYLTEAKADKLKNANAFAQDIVITHRGTLGQVGIIPKSPTFSRYVISQSQMLLTADNSKTTPRFIFEFLRSTLGMQQLLAFTSQTGVPAIARPTTSLKSLNVIEAPLPVFLKFDSLLAPLVDCESGKLSEIRTLAATRDLLLPKLMSGEIQLREAERAVGGRGVKP